MSLYTQDSVGHRPFSEHAHEMTGYTWHLPVKMTRRNVQVLVVVLTLILTSLRRKRGTRLLIERWQGQYNAPHVSLTWLRCDKDPSNRSLMFVLRCEPCQKYEAQIKGQIINLIQVCGSKRHQTSRQAVLYSR